MSVGVGCGESISAPAGTERGGSTNVVAVAFSRDGKRVAAAFANRFRGDWSRSVGTVRLWDQTLHEVGPTFVYPCYQPEMDAVITFSPDGEQLAAAYGRSMRLRDATSGRPLLALNDFDSSIGSIAYTPDGSSILSRTAEGLVEIRDARFRQSHEETSSGHAPER
jgi:WD40 repeat protein